MFETNLRPEPILLHYIIHLLLDLYKFHTVCLLVVNRIVCTIFSDNKIKSHSVSVCAIFFLERGWGGGLESNDSLRDLSSLSGQVMMFISQLSNNYEQ